MKYSIFVYFNTVEDFVIHTVSLTSGAAGVNGVILR